GPTARRAISPSLRGPGRFDVRKTTGVLPLLHNTLARPRDFHKVSLLARPPLVVVKAPETSKYHGIPSPSTAIKLIVAPTPRKREFLWVMRNPASVNRSSAIACAAFPSLDARAWKSSAEALRPSRICSPGVRTGSVSVKSDETTRRPENDFTAALTRCL